MQYSNLMYLNSLLKNKNSIKKRKIQDYYLDVDAKIPYNKVNLKEKIALVMGPEKSKVSNDFKKCQILLLEFQCMEMLIH